MREWNTRDSAVNSLQRAIGLNNRFVSTAKIEMAKDPDVPAEIPDPLRISVIAFSMSPDHFIRIPLDQPTGDEEFEALGLQHLGEQHSHQMQAPEGREGTLWIPKPETRGLLENMIMGYAAHAVPFNPHIVCLPEMTFPYPPPSTTPGDAAEFLQQLIDLYSSSKTTPCILAGSYHSATSGCNLAVLACPERNGGNRYFYYLHQKKQAAPRNAEAIVVPDRGVRYYETIVGTLGVKVCLDLYDASQLLQTISLNANGANRVPIVLAPCYAMRDIGIFREACEDLSALMQNILVVSHASPEFDHFGAVWLRGKELTPHPSSTREVFNFEIPRDMREKAVVDRYMHEDIETLFRGAMREFSRTRTP